MYSIDLAPHQLEGLENLANGKILCGGVGTGKTRTALAYYFLKACGGGLVLNGEGSVKPMETPLDLYVITTAKKRDTQDWQDAGADIGLTSERSLSANGVTMTVDSWNKIGEYAHIQGAIFIFDEQRLVGSGAWVKSFLKIAKHNQWILLSATPGDTWSDYIPVFVANGFYKNRTEFMDRHVVWSRKSNFPKIQGYVGTRILVRARRELLVFMDYENPRTRIIHTVSMDWDRDLWRMVAVKRWDPFKDEPIKDASARTYAARRVVNSHTERLGAILELVKKHPRLIVWYNFDYELETLRVLGGSLYDYTVAEWNGHKHEPVPEGDSWIYLVQYTAGSEAWNCTTTDAMAFYSLQYSHRVFEQCMGRTDRMDSPFTELHYYVLRSLAPIDVAIWRALRDKKRFNEAAFWSGK